MYDSGRERERENMMYTYFGRITVDNPDITLQENMHHKSKRFNDEVCFHAKPAPHFLPRELPPD
jgi:hypothetical protein